MAELWAILRKTLPRPLNRPREQKGEVGEGGREQKLGRQFVSPTFKPLRIRVREPHASDPNRKEQATLATLSDDVTRGTQCACASEIERDQM